jgi:predicted PurR-regulated permease PerM
MSATPKPRTASRYHAFAVRALIASSITIGLLLLVTFFWYATHVILLLIAGSLLAIMLSAAIEVVEQKSGLGRGGSLAIVLVLLAITLAALGAFAAPVLANQANELATKLPESLAKIEDVLKSNEWTRWLLKQAPDLEKQLVNKDEMYVRAGGALTSLSSALFSAFIVFFVAIYLAADPGLYTRGILRLVPLDQRERASVVLASVGYTIRWWLIGQLIVMTVVGLFTTIGLWLLGMPMALLLGFVAFLLDSVPNFGPIVAAFPAVLLALVESPQMAFYVIGVYLAVQQFEGLVISPIVMQKTVSIPPVLTISAQIFMAVVAGPLGILLAAPLTAVVLVLVKMLYVEEVLNDDIPTPEENIEPKDKPELP